MTRSMSLVKRFLVFSALEPATLVISFLPKACCEYSFNCFFLAKMKDSPQISNEICCMIHLLFFLSSYVIRMQELGLVVGVFHRVATMRQSSTWLLAVLSQTF